jgi:hypothetical protein
MGALLARYEWALIELLVIGIAVYELISINRSISRDKKAKVAKAEPKPPTNGAA